MEKEIKKDTVVKKKVDKKSEETFPPKEEDFFKVLLNDPILKSVAGGCKDLFKKKEADPNMCEITIKAPSEVVLKLFNRV